MITAKSNQVTKYFNHYRLVLVTNYREFRLIGDDGAGEAIELDRYSIAPDEASFWILATKPHAAAEQHAIHFSEFLRRVMMIAAPLVRAEDLAWFIASYARDALRARPEANGLPSFLRRRAGRRHQRHGAEQEHERVRMGRLP